MSGSSERSTAPGERSDGQVTSDAESSTAPSGAESGAAPRPLPLTLLTPPAEASLAHRLSRCELDLGLEVIEEDGGGGTAPGGRRPSDAEVLHLDALHYRLSLYLNDREQPEQPEQRRRSRHQVSRRGSEMLPRPAGAGAAASLCRRHSELAPFAATGGRRLSRHHSELSVSTGGRRGARRHSRRPSSRPGSRAGSCVGSTRRLHCADSGLLPSSELEPKERRRRQVVLAVMAGAFIIISMSVGLIFVMLYLTSSESGTDGIGVRKDNEENYQGIPMFNLTTTTAIPADSAR